MSRLCYKGKMRFLAAKDPFRRGAQTWQLGVPSAANVSCFDIELATVRLLILYRVAGKKT